MIQNIYLDYAASTPVDSRVLDEMTAIYKNHWGNSSAVHSYGKYLQQYLDTIRNNLAKSINAKSTEIIFTSSATESNNMVLFGLQTSKRHLIISNIEHPSIEKAADILQKRGWEITSIRADNSGYIDPQDIRDTIRSDTALVSIQYVNNELGTIQPIEAISKICKEKNVLFHTDASQGFGKLKMDVECFNIDFLSASSQKIYGPLGAGLLYIRDGITLNPLLTGGGQENERRASTVNVPAIGGFVKAQMIYEEEREEERSHLLILKKTLIDSIQSEIPNSHVNGKQDDGEGIYNILNISFKNTDNELLAMQLDREGFSVSTGSACSAGKVKVSRILKACGVPVEWARGSLRISLGRMTTKEQIEQFIKILPASVRKVRKIS